MPWQNNGGSGGPWGNGGGGGNDDGPRNPWGGGGNRGGGNNRPNVPDFDEFIRRSQERLRGMGGGSGGGRRGPVLPQVPWAWIVGGIVLLWIVLTSAYRVDAGERGVVTRFGAFVETTTPGFHFKLPAPIDQVTKVKFEQVNSVDIGGSEGNSENLMLTGDQNIIDIAYTVRWRIKDAEQYLFQLAQPEQTLREVAESAMRAAIGAATLNDAIGPQRAQIAEDVRVRIEELLDSYKAGISIEGVDIKQADPPSAVDEAFKDVSAAQQDAEQSLNRARGYAQQILAQAQGAAASFNAVYGQYKLNPEVTRKRLYLETMEQVLRNADKTVVEPQSGVTTVIPLDMQRRTATPVQEPQQTVTAPAAR